MECWHGDDMAIALALPVHERARLVCGKVMLILVTDGITGRVSDTEAKGTVGCNFVKAWGCSVS